MNSVPNNSKIRQMIISAIAAGKDESDKIEWGIDSEFGECHETQFAHIIARYFNSQNWYTELEAINRYDIYAYEKDSENNQFIVEIKRLFLGDKFNRESYLPKSLNKCYEDLIKLENADSNLYGDKYFVLISYGDPVSSDNSQSSKFYKFLVSPNFDTHASHLPAIPNLDKLLGKLRKYGPRVFEMLKRSKRDKHEYSVSIWQIPS